MRCNQYSVQRVQTDGHGSRTLSAAVVVVVVVVIVVVVVGLVLV